MTKREARVRRKVRIRKKIQGTSERPRLVVFRSNLHLYAQLVDDTGSGSVLAAASSLSMGKAEPMRMNKDTAEKVGLEIARLAKERSIGRVVFDRNGFQYHGRVKALADGAREGGLEF